MRFGREIQLSSLEKESNMKILITTPPLNNLAGVSSHYRGLRPYWSKDVQYFIIGPSKWRTVLFPFYVLKFIYNICLFKPDIVLINPSMTKKAIFRDFTYLNVAKLFKCKVAIMFHGFHVEEVTGKEKTIKNQLNRCSIVFVLSNIFKTTLKNWGVSTPIYTTTTQVSDSLIRDFNIHSRTGRVNNILYLARVTKAKGIFVALDVFKELSKKYPKLNYTVVGNGADLKAAIEYAKINNIPNLAFTGGLSGESLIEAYKNADLYLFTSYHEGMPTSVLEAMAFGLPVITRPVGGLIDFFETAKMGYLINSDTASDYMEVFDQLLNNPALVKDISNYNHQYATSNFLASKVAHQIERELNNIS